MEKLYKKEDHIRNMSIEKVTEEYSEWVIKAKK